MGVGREAAGSRIRAQIHRLDVVPLEVQTHTPFPPTPPPGPILAPTTSKPRRSLSSPARPGPSAPSVAKRHYLHRAHPAAARFVCAPTDTLPGHPRGGGKNAQESEAKDCWGSQLQSSRQERARPQKQQKSPRLPSAPQHPTRPITPVTHFFLSTSTSFPHTQPFFFSFSSILWLSCRLRAETR